MFLRLVSSEADQPSNFTHRMSCTGNYLASCALTRSLALISVFFAVTGSQLICAAEVPESLINQLKDKQFQVREKAQTDLVEWGEKNGDKGKVQLYKLSENAEHPEVRLRSHQVLRELIDAEYELNGEGFIGIYMDEVLNLDSNVAPKAKSGIRVTAVMMGHGAEAAGMQQNDIIIGIKDHDFPDGLSTDGFKKVISGMKPREKVTLSFIRNNELKNAEVTLGKRPIQVLDPRFGGRDRELQLEQRAKDEYFQKWIEKNATN